MQSDEVTSRALAPSERQILVVVGVAMLGLSFLSLAVTVAFAVPMLDLIEGLSK